MKHLSTRIVPFITTVACLLVAAPADADELHFVENAREGGNRSTQRGAITWLSWEKYPDNSVNIADPGRLIQQSYYVGKSLDRRDEGQSKAWSPWTWNPIQGGGVGS
ncbi:MAG: hypothetical protein R3C56_36745 [Pirellulaceae bacterium]